MKAISRIASKKTVRKAMLNIDHLPLPYVETDARGIITRANRAALALHHPEQGELIGKNGWDLMAIDEKDRSSAAFLALMATGKEPPVIRRSIYDRSARFRTYEMHRSLIRSGKRKVAGIRMVCMDVTETTKALDEAQHNCQWLESAMRSFAEAVILTDALGLIRSVNPAAEKLCGWTAAELDGMAIDEILPVQARPGASGAVLDLQAMLQRPLKGVATVMTREWSQVKVEIGASPIFDKESGSLSGVAAILRRVDEGH